MTPTFSLLHASYGRALKASGTAQLWLDRADIPGLVQYILATNDDGGDGGMTRQMVDSSTARHLTDVVHVTGPFRGSAPAWDAAAKAAQGIIMIQVSDDVEPPDDWDVKLIEAVVRNPDAERLPFVVGVGDGHRPDKLMTTAICSRSRYRQTGEFIHPGYHSVFSDDEFTVRAYADQAAGKCTVVEARELVFLHRHHYHDKSVPMDATYQRGNSAEAYKLGHDLFHRRNADFLKFRSW